jgi:7-cyano-7-deazaguanine synthase
MKDTLIILSGGMDSTVALYQGQHRIGLAISFNYGSKHNDEENVRAKRSCARLGIEHRRVNLMEVGNHLKSDLLKSGGEIPEGHYADENMRKTVVPFRNGIMLSIACGIAESHGLSQVMIGNHFGDHAVYPDCRRDFIDAMEKAMVYGTYAHVKISSPFVEMTKTEIAKLGDYLGVHWEETYSCYKGKYVHCGRCSTCYERREAFVDASVKDPTEYTDTTPFEELRKEYEADHSL